MRSMKEINDAGIRALVAVLGKEDAQRFLAQFRQSPAPAAAGTAFTRADAPPSDEAAAAAHDDLPPMTVEEAHEAIRDMHDPIEQQHLL